MRRILPLGCFFVLALASACDSADTDGTDSGGSQPGGNTPVGGTPVVGGAGGEVGVGGGTGGMGGAQGGAGGAGGAAGGSGPVCDGTPAECAAIWEENASDALDMLVGGPQPALEAFLAAVPKGGDLHNHLSGAVYAETYLDWAETENYCINTTTFQATSSSSCGGTTQDVPTSGSFYDNIIGAWSMEGFVPGAETGHDHFFATFGKYGAIAGAHRFDSIADVAVRAASENQIYVETMFNLGQNIGQLTDDNWVGTLNASDLQAAYDLAVNDPSFDTELQQDVASVNQARTGYRMALGCSGANPPAACDVDVRFTAQVSRLSSRATIFGQLLGAFEMATQTDAIVGVNLSSPEDEVSATGYDVQMAMLDFLYEQYTATGVSPIRVTLHAGELTDTYGTPAAMQGNIRKAVEIAHAERIGHGLSVLSDADPQGLLDEMRDQRVLVEVCLSSNDQILEVSGSDHPLATYLENQVPVALATDDQGVSRSSMAGEYLRAVLDQGLNYRQLKLIARQSLEHAFVPGDSLWLSIGDAETVSACAPTDTMGVGDPPNAACEAFLATSERATLQWKLEHNFREFESQQ